MAIASRSMGEPPWAPLFRVAGAAAEQASVEPRAVSASGGDAAAEGAASAQVAPTPPPRVELASLPQPARRVADGRLSTFNGRTVRAAAKRRMLVTAYCPCAKCCGKHADGMTAAGYSVFTNGGKLVAADPRVLPFGSLIAVPGYADAKVVPVLDSGKDIKGNRLDVLFHSHRNAREWGTRWVEVTIYKLEE